MKHSEAEEKAVELYSPISDKLSIPECLALQKRIADALVKAALEGFDAGWKMKGKQITDYLALAEGGYKKE